MEENWERLARVETKIDDLHTQLTHFDEHISKLEDRLLAVTLEVGKVQGETKNLFQMRLDDIRLRKTALLISLALISVVGAFLLKVF